MDAGMLDAASVEAAAPAATTRRESVMTEEEIMTSNPGRAIALANKKAQTPSATLSALRDIARRCLAAEPLTPAQLQLLGVSLARFIERASPSIEDALGLKFPRGGVPWWREEALRTRNAALRELAARCYAGRTVSAQAHQVWLVTSRYAGSAWRFDRERDEMPAAYAGTEKQYVWIAFASRAPMPICERHLRTILGR
jgi:hypothetical protein